MSSITPSCKPLHFVSTFPMRFAAGVANFAVVFKVGVATLGVLKLPGIKALSSLRWEYSTKPSYNQLNPASTFAMGFAAGVATFVVYWQKLTKFGVQQMSSQAPNKWTKPWTKILKAKASLFPCCKLCFRSLLFCSAILDNLIYRHFMARTRKFTYLQLYI